jgi:anthranilate/para-aminobenzoate synthase component I
VADSQPEAEHEECVNKARAVITAIELVRQSPRNASGVR